MIYIERIKLAGHTLRLSSTSLQRLLAVAVMVAAKFLDEPFYSNKWWCESLMRSVPSPSPHSSLPSHQFSAANANQYFQVDLTSRVAGRKSRD